MSIDVDDFFADLAKFARDNNYAISAGFIMTKASSLALDIGSITWLGRKHLIPRGWKRYETVRGVIYLPPKEEEGGA